jgi:hypothetical protein
MAAGWVAVLGWAVLGVVEPLGHPAPISWS